MKGMDDDLVFFIPSTTSERLTHTRLGQTRVHEKLTCTWNARATLFQVNNALSRVLTILYNGLTVYVTDLRYRSLEIPRAWKFFLTKNIETKVETDHVEAEEWLDDSSVHRGLQDYN